MRKIREALYRFSVITAAAIGAATLLLLAGWMLAAALPALRASGISFLMSPVWEPTRERFGISAMLLSSIGTALGAVAAASPAALCAALIFGEFCHPAVGRAFFALNRILSGLPSVLYGLIGMTCLVPVIDRKLYPLTAAAGGTGGLAVILILSLMVLPSLVTGYEQTLRAVPQAPQRASAALGATKAQTAFCCILPSIRRSVRLHAGNALRRALGEATAVLLVSGNVVRLPSLFAAQRTLAGTIVLEMGYAAGKHRSALFAIGLFLLLSTALLPSAQGEG